MFKQLKLTGYELVYSVKGAFTLRFLFGQYDSIVKYGQICHVSLVFRKVEC